MVNCKFEYYIYFFESSYILEWHIAPVSKMNRLERQRYFWGGHAKDRGYCDSDWPKLSSNIPCNWHILLFSTTLESTWIIFKHPEDGGSFLLTYCPRLQDELTVKTEILGGGHAKDRGYCDSDWPKLSSNIPCNWHIIRFSTTLESTWIIFKHPEDGGSFLLRNVTPFI